MIIINGRIKMVPLFPTISLFLMIPTLLAQQNDQNLNSTVNTNNQLNGCSKPASYYQPCECTDWGDGNIKLNCDDKNIGDAKVSRILKDFLADPVAAKLRSLWLANNQLTRVPPEISKLIHLEHIDLAYNNIHTIRKGEISFGPAGGSLDLRYNQLSHIEDGAFQGTISDRTYFTLDDNNLTRVESGAFRDSLVKMRAFGGASFTFMRMNSNPIDCETDYCHMAWLIRDHRYLLKALVATCSNGTHFDDLDPNGYANCSSKFTEGQFNNDSKVAKDPILDSSNSLKSVYCPDETIISPCVCENYGLESNSGMLALHCGVERLTDTKVSDILQVFVSNASASSRLVRIDLPGNRLTQIPKQIRHFSQLSQLDLGENKITHIKSGDFNFTSTMDIIARLFLHGNEISHIEPEAFLGNYSNGIQVLLMNNKLTQLDAQVFKFPLDQIASNRQNADYAHFRFDNNPLECDPCNMSWLLRDNRHFIRQSFVHGTCLTGGAVTQLETVKLDDFICASDSKNNGLDTKMIVTIASIGTAVFAIIFLIGIYYKYQKNKKTFKSVEALLKGNLGAINRNKTLDEQTEFLPYDQKWEFPKNRLRFGVELGSGAFGRVIQAEAIGIDKQRVTTVAVKMVRTQVNKVAALEALICELKVMIHLGKHLNIVNLLGACTKHISKGEVFVIVEYCRYGNLLSYLMAHRQNFVNEVDESGNLADYLVANGGESIISRITQSEENYIIAEGSVQTETNVDQQRQPVNYDDGMELSTEGQSFSGWEHEKKNKRKENIYLSELKTEKKIEDNQIQQNDPAEDQQQPEWSINYKTNEAYLNNEQSVSLSTRELVYWSFQIARAMDYLSSKKVIHGDLAARNVLLADDGIVKVADFGLSRRLYHDDNYMKQSQDKLPVKWMALESLTEMVFSSQSDVWSFGIVLWELFSLGKTPYPGMGLNLLIRELQSGYRMDKPQFASNDIGQLMSDCWRANPTERPTFHNLQEALGNQLESSASGHYMQMNDYYLSLDGINNTSSMPSSSMPTTAAAEEQNKRSIWHEFIRKKKPKLSEMIA